MSPLCIRAVWIGEQRAVLLCDEESWRNGIHTDALAKFLGTFSGHVGGEVVDASFCGRIAADAGEWPEGRHRREIDDATLSLLGHRMQKHLCGDDCASEIQLQDTLEIIGIQVEDILFRANRGSRHVSSCGVEESVYARVPINNILAYLFHTVAVEHVGGKEFESPPRVLLVGSVFFRDALYNSVSFFSVAALTPSIKNLTPAPIAA